ncbi:hypothetical protein SLA2020_488460 [Shorea laevis]
MAGEEQNTQQPTGGKGARFHTKKQIISKGELPKQKGAGGISFHEDVKTINKAGPSVPSKKRNRGCPSSGLSEQDREIDDFTSFSIEMKPMVDCIEMDDSTSFSTEMKPMDDFIEMDDLTSFRTGMKPVDDFIEMDDFTSLTTEMFGSFFDGQTPTLGGEEAIVNESPHYKNESLRFQNIEEATTNERVNQDTNPMDDFIEMNDFTSFCTEMMPMDDLTSFNNELMPMGDFIEMDDFTSSSTEMVQWEDYNDQSCLVHQYSLNKLENKIIK